MLTFAGPIFLGALLLFAVQPILARAILPWFGGSPAVWTTCMLFFQVVLLLGYAYAHALCRGLRPRTQAAVHLALLALALAWLPLVPDAGWKPTAAGDPTWRILGLLGTSVGLPYLLLCATGPLLQSWFARVHPGRSPYRLYALSNAGSVLALVGYPVALEPALGTRAQAQAWSAGFGAFVLLCGAVAWGQWRRAGGGGEAAAPVPLPATDPPDPPAGAEAPPGAAYHLLWLGLAACPSVLLLAVTNQVCQEVAVIPFLWVLPLTLYLVSLIVCFATDRWSHRGWWTGALVLALLAMGYTLDGRLGGHTLPAVWEIPVDTAGLFVCCMVCHRELVKLRPAPEYLTTFYLECALGGALGGVFVGLVAPRIFAGYYELQVGMVACALLALVAGYRDPASRLRRSGLQVPWLGICAWLIALGGVVLWQQVYRATRGARLIVRNFYGAMRVLENKEPGDPFPVRWLVHGITQHGKQYLDPARRRTPTLYYGGSSGVGLALLCHHRSAAQRVGVIGLGTGTLAAYGRAGDRYCFYDINPLVLEMARSEFFYLQDCPAQVEVVLGDARLALEREPPRRFDVLAVDAFSSDSVPVHLLTREAVDLYFRHLAPDGILALHASNRSLDLRAVAAGVAAASGREGRVVRNPGQGADGLADSTWVLLTADSGFLADPRVQAVGTDVREFRREGVTWTDDYSSVFRILK